MLIKYGMYVQFINYLIVECGKERLCIVFIFEYNEVMMDKFIEVLVKVWKDNGMCFLIFYCIIVCDCQECCIIYKELDCNKYVFQVGVQNVG